MSIDQLTQSLSFILSRWSIETTVVISGVLCTHLLRLLNLFPVL